MTDSRIKELEQKFKKDHKKWHESKKGDSDFIFQWIVDNVIKAKEEEILKCAYCSFECYDYKSLSHHLNSHTYVNKY